MSSRANRAVKKSVSPRMNKLNRGLTSVGVNHTNHTSNRNYSKQKKIRRRNVPPPPQLLLCKHKFESQKPTQMSFAKGLASIHTYVTIYIYLHITHINICLTCHMYVCVCIYPGDVIQLIEATGNWHRGK